MKNLIGIIAFGLIISTVANAETNKDKEESCLTLLGAGIYNGVLEDVCKFDGGVKDKLKALYTEGGCRNIVPQEKVEETSSDVLIDSKERFQTLGESKFCNGNKEAYYDLVKESDSTESSKADKEENPSSVSKDFSGWWGMTPEGCIDDMDNKYRVALGRWKSENGKVNFGVGKEEAVGTYDDTCILSRKKESKNTVTYKASCQGEDGKVEGMGKIVEENEFTVRVFMPTLSDKGLLLTKCSTTEKSDI